MLEVNFLKFGHSVCPNIEQYFWKNTELLEFFLETAR